MVVMVAASAGLLMIGALSSAGHVGGWKSFKNCITFCFFLARHHLHALLLIFLCVLCLIQLCRLSEDLAAFPDAGGNHPYSGPGPQPAVTWEGRLRTQRETPAGRTWVWPFRQQGVHHTVSSKWNRGDEDFSPPRGWLLNRNVQHMYTETFVESGQPVAVCGEAEMSSGHKFIYTESWVLRKVTVQPHHLHSYQNHTNTHNGLWLLKA